MDPLEIVLPILSLTQVLVIMDLLLFVASIVDSIVKPLQYRISCMNLNSFPVILDASPNCNQVTFNLGGTSTASRSWDIKGCLNNFYSGTSKENDLF